MLITKRFSYRRLATGASFKHLAFEFSMSYSTVGLIVKGTLQILWDILQPLHMPPLTVEKFEKIAEECDSIGNFPQCLGAIDGKHLRIICPAHSGTMYFSYRSYFSNVIQWVADAICKVTIIDGGGYSKQSDGGTFRLFACLN
jgi:hypothetical protein